MWRRRCGLGAGAERGALEPVCGAGFAAVRCLERCGAGCGVWGGAGLAVVRWLKRCGAWSGAGLAAVWAHLPCAGRSGEPSVVGVGKSTLGDSRFAPNEQLNHPRLTRALCVAGDAGLAEHHPEQQRFLPSCLCLLHRFFLS